MPSRKIIIAISLVAGMVAAGCGKVELVQVDATGNGGNPSAGGPSLNRTPVVVAPTPAPAPTYNPPLSLGKFEVKVTKCDCSAWKLGLFTKTAYIEVKNPTQVPLKGTVKVQFTDNGSPIADISAENKQIELTPGETQNFTVSAKSMKIDNAAATVQMDGDAAPGMGVPTVPGATAGGNGAGASVYGAPPGFGR